MILCSENTPLKEEYDPEWMELKALVKSTKSNVAFFQKVMSFFCPYAFKDSTDGQYLWGRGSISSEAILVFPKDVVDFGFYAVSL